MIGAHFPRHFLYANLERVWPVINAETFAWQSLGQLLHEQARRFGSRTLFRFQGEAMTFAQVEEQTNRLAHALKARGIG